MTGSAPPAEPKATREEGQPQIQREESEGRGKAMHPLSLGRGGEGGVERHPQNLRDGRGWKRRENARREKTTISPIGVREDDRGREQDG